jgi:acyl carrier protein
MHDHDVIKILMKVFSEDSESVIKNLSKSESNWDSLKSLQLILELEDYLGSELSEVEIEELEDFSSIVKLVNRKK